jgi:hypothetical protein
MRVIWVLEIPLVRPCAICRENPERQIKPLCSAVAAVVLGDGARGAAVRAEVEKELERWEELR